MFGQGLIRDFDSSALGFSSSITNPLTASSKTYPRFTGYYNVPFDSPSFPKWMPRACFRRYTPTRSDYQQHR